MLKSASIYFLSALLVCASSAYAIDEIPPNIGGFDQNSWKDVPDTKLEGYIQALLDINFYESQTEIHVKGKTAYLSNLPKNQLLTTSIKSFVRDIPGIERIVIVKTPGSRDGRMDEIKQKKKKKKISGIWFPQTNVLFQPLVADPRTVKYSLGYRMGDKVMGRRAAEVSFGDDFPLYRWKNVWVNGGDLQFGIEAGAVATLLLFLLPVLALKTAINAMRKRQNSLMQGLAFGCSMAIIGMSIHMSVDFPLQAPANTVLFIVILALAQLTDKKIKQK